MYWSAGALKEKEVELWSATKKGLERWSAVTPGRAPRIEAQIVGENSKNQGSIVGEKSNN